MNMVAVESYDTLRVLGENSWESPNTRFSIDGVTFSNKMHRCQYPLMEVDHGRALLRVGRLTAFRFTAKARISSDWNRSDAASLRTLKFLTFGKSERVRRRGEKFLDFSRIFLNSISN